MRQMKPECHISACVSKRGGREGEEDKGAMQHTEVRDKGDSSCTTAEGRTVSCTEERFNYVSASSGYRRHPLD